MQGCGKDGMFLSLMKKDICQRETSAATIHACGFVCHMLCPTKSVPYRINKNRRNGCPQINLPQYLRHTHTQTKVHINLVVLLDCESGAN